MGNDLKFFKDSQFMLCKFIAKRFRWITQSGKLILAGRKSILTADHLRIVESLLEKEDFHIVGKNVTRVESLSHVLGRSKYTADYLYDKMLYVKVVRSKHPHALIKRIDTSKARNAPGVVAVLTAEDIPGINDWGYTFPDQPLLSYDKVRFLGDGVALVAAESIDQAESAVELVDVDYEPLQPIFSPLEALKSQVKIHEKGNIAYQCRLRKGDVTKAFLDSDVVVENEYKTPQQEHAYMEPEAAIAIPEPDGSVTIIGSLQSPFTVQMNVAKILGYSLDKVRVIQAATGGGFGGKDDIPPEVASRAALVAIRTGRVAFLGHTREESITAHNKRHAYLIKYKSGATKKGKLTAAEIEIISDVGAYASHGPYVLWRSTVHSTGPYEVPNAKVDSYLVYTNKLYGGSFRGFGNPQIQFAAESQLDELARLLNMDPVELRMNNVLKPGSLTVSSQCLDHSVGIEDCLKTAAELSKWKDKRNALQNQSGVKRRGIGVGLMWHGNSTSRGAPDYSAASVIVNKDGSIRFRTGITEMGQGTHTGIVQIISEILGVPADMIHVDNPDTSAVPDSGPTHASRGLVRGGAAAMVAAYKIRENLNKVAAEILGCKEDEVEILDAKAYSKNNPSKTVNFQELALQCYNIGLNPSCFGYFRAPKMVFDQENGQGEAYSNFTFAAHIVEIEVDIETGQIQVLKVTPVYDAGKAINPLLLKGQIEGAALQGMGYAIMEEIVYDGAVIMNPTFQDYHIPTSMDIPEIDPTLVEHRFRYGPFGAKGMGEAPLIPMASAIANAIYNAVGVRIKELPATPERVLAAIQKGRS